MGLLVLDGWRISTWGDEVTLNYGKALRGYDRIGGRFRVFGTNGPVGWHDEALAPGPGVILGRKGAYRGVHYSPEAFWVIDTAYYLTPKSKMNMRWLYYAAIHYRLGSIDDGSPIPSTTRSAVSVIDFVIPPLHVQDAIAAILGSLDDKIELNRRMNKTLEAMAQAIFRDWFVDFGPTRRKLAGITDPVEIMGGLVQDATHAAELAALFPNALGDDGLPEGWEKKPVGELAYIRGGKQLPKDEFDPAGNVPIFGGAGLMGFTNKSNADGFVITIGRVGAYCGKLFTYRGRAWVNNNASQFIPKSSVPPEWLYLSLCQLDIHNIRRGAAQPFVSNSDLAALSVVVPDDSILPQFMWLVTPIIIKSEQAASESRILAATRDLLLPKLMSGEIRLREAEKIAEAAP